MRKKSKTQKLRNPFHSRRPKDRYEWEKAIISNSGPKSPTTRLVLLVIATHLDSRKLNCYPSYKLIAKESGLVLRTVKTHMNIAFKEGWFLRTERMGHASGWKRYEYEVMIPMFEKESSVVVQLSPKDGANKADIGESVAH